MKFKVGDKVRVYNKDASMLGSHCLNNGDETEVVLDLQGEGIAVRDTVRGGTPVALTHEEAEATLTKLEEEITLTNTKRVAVAKIDSEGTEIHEQQQFKKGETFDVLTEPIDFMTMIVFAQLQQNNDLERAVVINFGEGFIVFFNEDSERAWNVNDFFEIKEVA